MKDAASSEPREIRALLIEGRPERAHALAELSRAGSRLGVTIDPAPTLEQAARRIDSSKSACPDVLLLDLCQNETSPLETLDAARHLLPGVPIVALASSEDAALAIEATRRGAQDYLFAEELSTPLLLRSLRHAVERHRVERQLLQAQKMEAIGKLAGGIAHDFNNLLTVILGHLDMVLADNEFDAEAHNAVEVSLGAAQRATHLTRQLLAFSRQQVMSVEQVDLNQIVEGMLPILNTMIGDGIELTLDLQEDLPGLLGDRSQLEQVLLNLVVNARDAIATVGAISINTRVQHTDASWRSRHEPQPDGAYVVLEVRDDGCGMDDETQAQIFDPFFTTKASQGGTGLGLSTIYGIVKQSSGFIWLESEIGKGTRFEVHFPSAESARDAESTPEDLPASGEIDLAQRATVLVVEDNAEVRELVVSMLEGAHYDVVAVAGGAEALDHLERNPGTVDLLLTDVVMPRMSGPALAERAREREPALEVLFASGYTVREMARYGLIDPEERLVPKPFTRATLLTALRRALSAKPRTTRAS